MLVHRASAALASVLLAAGLSTPATASAGAAPVADAAQVVKRDVRLGHKPVNFHVDTTTVRLTFDGRRGQLVHLAHWTGMGYTCLTTRLRRHGASDVRPWAADGYWKLRRSGTYTVAVKTCEGTSRIRSKVQIRKVVVQQAEVDGPSIRPGFNQDVTRLVKVPLAAGERLKVDNFHNVTHLLLPGHPTPERVSRERIYLEAGTQPAYGAAVSSVGDHYLVMRPDTRGTVPDTPVRVTRALHHRGALDGPAIPLANGGVAERMHMVTFDAPAGAWVYGVATSSSGSVVATGEVIGRDGRSLNHYGAVQIETAGTYRMQLTVPQSLAGDSFSLRVRTAAVAEPLTLDGPPVAYTAGTPGQWVIGPYTEGLHDGEARVTATEVAASLTDWGATLFTGRANNCPPDDTSNGCPDYWVTHVSPGQPTAWVAQDGNVGPSMVLLRVPPTVQGSLKLTLSRR